jgi:hypothetical protein
MTKQQFERCNELSDIFYCMDENEWNAVGRPDLQDWLDLDTDEYNKFMVGEYTCDDES